MLKDFDDIDVWKAIILYGLDQATYKIAHGKAILELEQTGHATVGWAVLSKVYLDIFIERLSHTSLPQ